MLSNEQTLEIEPAIKTMQIIIGALILGPMAAAILFFVIRPEPKFTDSLAIIPIAGIAMAISCFVASFAAPIFLRPNMIKESTKTIDEKEQKVLSPWLVNKLLMVTQTSLIIQCALIEGAVFANLIFWFLDGSIYNAATAVVGFILMIVQFPFSNRVVSTIESMYESVK